MTETLFISIVFKLVVYCRRRFSLAIHLITNTTIWLTLIVLVMLLAGCNATQSRLERIIDQTDFLPKRLLEFEPNSRNSEKHIARLNLPGDGTYDYAFAYYGTLSASIVEFDDQNLMLQHAQGQYDLMKLPSDVQETTNSTSNGHSFFEIDGLGEHAFGKTTDLFSTDDFPILLPGYDIDAKFQIIYFYRCTAIVEVTVMDPRPSESDISIALDFAMRVDQEIKKRLCSEQE